MIKKAGRQYRIRKWQFLALFIYPLMIFSMVCASETPETHQWILEKESKGVTLFSRKNNNTEFNTYRGTVVLKTTLNTLVSLLEDAEAAPEWKYRCAKEEVIGKVSPAERYIRTEFSTPVIFPNRDAIMRSVRIQDPATKIVTITLEGKHDYLPEQTSFVRIQKIQESWTLMPLSGEEVEVSYQLYKEPGGKIPPKLANKGNNKCVLQTLINMKKMIGKPKYKDAAGLVEE
ncbi:MAG: hypothetical protein FJ264_13890 [Planctomycetes bacterium]|nr:hypothetical protein [Planctomycetota bacterium]